MKLFISRFSILLIFSCCSLAADFKAAISVRNITPNPLLPVSGGVGPSSPTHTQKGNLTVRALVLADQDTRVAIVSTDFLGFPSVLGEKVRAQVSSIPSTNILIGATHTHSAPDAYGFPDGKGGFSADLKYLDEVCRKIAECINEAVSELKPVHLKIGTGKARGKIAFNYYAEKLYDPRCDVIQAIDATNGKPLATLVNYAIHPEVLGSNQGILSPDLIGPLYDRIAEKGHGTAIFMNGAQGGMVTADNRGPEGKDLRTWEECERIGKLLADESLRIISNAEIQKSPDLECFSKQVKFPIGSPLMKMIIKLSPLEYSTVDEDHLETTVNLVNIGNSQILTIPGEALPNIGFFLKRKMTGKHNLLFGLTNDAFGYILTQVDWNSFERYDYVSETGLGEMTGPIFIREALSMIKEFSDH